ncbi:TetR/AcrR family transcriptional regulator [Amycolatopsis nigrescens]|uniref:TetR/AcrR family transcriptional regulator n=1 Tax=Amycolatopsis nigrescens TaxID=381445 RepID=UPI00035C43BD|nr:TetR/AcrR family transcriptional regulator [Amycolatopsis nigrescens]
MRRYHHGDLRAALLARAEQTLREKGADALSLRQLAKDLGVSHAAPSRHFKDKRALLDALALTGLDRLAGAMERANTGPGDIRSRLLALARAYVDFAIAEPELLEVMYTGKHDPLVSDQVVAAGERLGVAILRPIVEAQEAGEVVAGDPAGIAMVAASALHGFASLTANGSFEKNDAPELLEGIIDHLLSGLSPR